VILDFKPPIHPPLVGILDPTGATTARSPKWREMAVVGRGDSQTTTMVQGAETPRRSGGRGGLSRALADGSSFPLPAPRSSRRIASIWRRQQGSWPAVRERGAAAVPLLLRLPSPSVRREAAGQLRLPLLRRRRRGAVRGSCKCICFYPCCWRRWGGRGMKNTVHTRQMPIGLHKMPLIVGLSLSFSSIVPRVSRSVVIM
jgi:hypothetical protein